MNYLSSKFLIITIFSMMATVLLAEKFPSISDTRENLVSKKEESLALCAYIESMNPTENDINFLIKNLTLANPEFALEASLTENKQVHNLFPSVKKLIELEEFGARSVLKAFEYKHINNEQVHINVAYVLSKSVGVQEALKMLDDNSSSMANNEEALKLLNKVRDVLASYSKDDNIHDTQTNGLVVSDQKGSSDPSDPSDPSDQKGSNVEFKHDTPTSPKSEPNDDEPTP